MSVTDVAMFCCPHTFNQIMNLFLRIQHISVHVKGFAYAIYSQKYVDLLQVNVISILHATTTYFWPNGVFVVEKSTHLCMC